MADQPEPNEPADEPSIGQRLAGMMYLDKLPSPGQFPLGLILVHNHVQPTRHLGLEGFRAWLDDPGDRYEVCPCD
jgi:hypothetical protein